jgi:gamma-glutamyl-gamma-aminobutyrate hydrolase PuuD
MADKITSDATMLMNQATSTANNYLHEAVQKIDGLLGPGYAKAHPELIGAFMNTAARDFHTSRTMQAIQDAVEELAEAIRSRDGSPPSG